LEITADVASDRNIRSQNTILTFENNFRII